MTLPACGCIERNCCFERSDFPFLRSLEDNLEVTVENSAGQQGPSLHIMPVKSIHPGHSEVSHAVFTRF